VIGLFNEFFFFFKHFI
jgi:hypothetical protein